MLVLHKYDIRRWGYSIHKEIYVKYTIPLNVVLSKKYVIVVLFKDKYQTMSIKNAQVIGYNRKSKMISARWLDTTFQ